MARGVVRGNYPDCNEILVDLHAGNLDRQQSKSCMNPMGTPLESGGPPFHLCTVL